MADTHKTRLSGLPNLFRSLMEQPLRPLTQARLPDRTAVYVFYQSDEPVHVGSPPHVEEVQLLAPSVRLAVSLSVTQTEDGGPGRVRLAGAACARDGRPPVKARWLSLQDDEDRMLLELYAAQSLGLSVSHPRIKAGLAKPRPAQIETPELSTQD